MATTNLNIQGVGGLVGKKSFKKKGKQSAGKNEVFVVSGIFFCSKHHAAPCEFSKFSVVFEPNSKSHLSAE